MNVFPVYASWKRTYALFPRKSIKGKKIWGKMWARTIEVADAGQHLTWYEYADEKEMFELKLKGKA